MHIKIRSAALLEALVAISILVTVFAIGTMIYVRVSASTYAGECIKAELMLHEKMDETIKTKTFFDSEEDVENILVKKTVEKYDKNPLLLIVRLVAMNKEQKVLSEKKQIILLDETEN